VLDRASGRPVFMASAAGGMDIEEVAAKTPEKILKETVDPAVGFRPFQARKLAFGLGLPAALTGQAAKFMLALYSAYEQMDASLLEINPFLLTKDNRLVALDAKVNFDDNALFRHQDFLSLRDLNEEEPLEIEASKFDLNYIKLDGNIACMVNGAGLAMATMDIIKLAGGEPANFLDVGGGASQERVEAAFRILLADPHVRAVLINIFGGIVRCDMVARGVVEAARKIGVQVPVVVRLEGTNVEEGQRVLRESGLNFTVADGMKDAAEKVVALAGQKAAA
jgi:succinyl-CoA synthetase beta subunit